MSLTVRIFLMFLFAFFFPWAAYWAFYFGANLALIWAGEAPLAMPTRVPILVQSVLSVITSAFVLYMAHVWKGYADNEGK